MAAGTGRSARVKKSGKADEAGKAFDMALQSLERQAIERINLAWHPFSTGVKIAGQLRDMADRVEREVTAENISMTEAAESVEL